MAPIKEANRRNERFLRLIQRRQLAMYAKAAPAQGPLVSETGSPVAAQIEAFAEIQTKASAETVAKAPVETSTETLAENPAQAPVDASSKTSASPSAEPPEELSHEIKNAGIVEVFNKRAKLFRFDRNLKEWKERGIGQVKLVKHLIENKMQILFIQEGVNKVVLNQLVGRELLLRRNSGNPKEFFFCAVELLEGSVIAEALALRFGSINDADKFAEILEIKN